MLVLKSKAKEFSNTMSAFLGGMRRPLLSDDTTPRNADRGAMTEFAVGESKRVGQRGYQHGRAHTIYNTAPSLYQQRASPRFLRSLVAPRGISSERMLLRVALYIFGGLELRSYSFCRGHPNRDSGLCQFSSVTS